MYTVLLDYVQLNFSLFYCGRNNNKFKPSSPYLLTVHKAKFKNTFDHSLYGVIKRSNYTLTTRLYSSKADKGINVFNNQTYFMKFSDADESKIAIMEKSQGKTGIYM